MSILFSNLEINSSITHLEGDINYTTIYFSDGKSKVSSYTLKRFEKLLSENANFLRTHKSYIINRNFVSLIHKKYIVLKDGTILPIARRRNIY